MILQLNPPLPLTTPRGKGWAHFLLDYSQEHDLLWVVFLNQGGECWTFPNSDIRMDTNFSLGRYDTSTDSLGIFSRDLSRQSGSTLDHRNDGQAPREETT